MKFLCRNHHPVEAEDFDAAARIFAGRKARATFGPNADVRTLDSDGHARDMRLVEYKAFIGLTKGRETTGHDIRFTVFKA